MPSKSGKTTLNALADFRNNAYLNGY